MRYFFTLECQLFDLYIAHALAGNFVEGTNGRHCERSGKPETGREWNA